MKRILCFFISFTVIVSAMGTVTVRASIDTFPFYGTDVKTEKPWLIGDPSWDGKIDATDALAALKMAVFGPPKCPGPLFDTKMEYYHYYRMQLCGDVDGSDRVTANDALMILQYAVGEIDGFDRTDFSSKKWERIPFPQS